MPDFSIIVPAHNRARTLDRTLATLAAQDYPAERYEILVADNNSTDETRDVVEGWRRKAAVPVRYHFESRPGVHYARNGAARLAGADVLYFTDDDMNADAGVLTAFRTLLDAHPRIAVATGRVLPEWEAPPPAWVLECFNDGNLSLQYREDESWAGHGDPGVWSCHEVIRKQVLFECGGFRPENTGGQWVGDGETGLHLEVEARGHLFGFTGKALTRHIIPPGRLTQTYFNLRFRNQGAADSFTRANLGPRAPRHLRRPPLAPLRWMAEAGRCLGARMAGRSSWHRHRANMDYWTARWHFDRRFRTDPALCALAQRTSWLDAQEK